MENPSRCMSFPVLCLFLFLVSDEAVCRSGWGHQAPIPRHGGGGEEPSRGMEGWTDVPFFFVDGQTSGFKSS